MFKYGKKVMRHFTHPKNVGRIKNADGIGKVGNPQCGDILHIYIKVGRKKIKGKNEEYIKNIKLNI